MAFSLGSLVFSASRAAFGAFFIMIFFVALVFKLYKLIGAGFLVLVGFGIYVFAFASEDFYFFVIDTLTFENTSSIGHVVEWLLALDSMVANPLGIGLAMSGNFGSVDEELRVGGGKSISDLWRTTGLDWDDPIHFDISYRNQKFNSSLLFNRKYLHRTSGFYRSCSESGPPVTSFHR